MPKRCPPGVICFENATIVFICVVIAIVGIWVYIRSERVFSAQLHQRHHQPTAINIHHNGGSGGGGASEGRGNDVFLDIYKAPLRDDRCSLGNGSDIRIAPSTIAPSTFNAVNVSTQGCGDAPYRQVGILTRLNGSDETILPLMGRPLFTRRDKWNFYTLNDKNNMIKLPVTVKGRSGTDEYGCDNVYTGDTVYVDGYNGAFKVTAYDNQVMRYLPGL